MDIQIIREFLLWCAVINFGILLTWFLFFLLAHDWIYRLHTRWFKIPRESFDTLHYTCMAIYKIAIITFNLVPFMVISIIA